MGLRTGIETTQVTNIQNHTLAKIFRSVFLLAITVITSLEPSTLARDFFITGMLTTKENTARSSRGNTACTKSASHLVASDFSPFRENIKYTTTMVTRPDTIPITSTGRSPNLAITKAVRERAKPDTIPAFQCLLTESIPFIVYRISKAKQTEIIGRNRVIL